MLAPLLGLPRQAEILIIIFLGISFLSLDFSLFHLKGNLKEVWNIELNQLHYLEMPIKYVIGAIVLVRTFTLHAFLAFYIVMLWPAIFEEKPSLMLPWLLMGILRCLIVNGITLVLGTFICQKEHNFFSPICFEYVLAQIIEHGPSVYAWVSVLSFYRGLVATCDSQRSSLESLLSHDSEIIIDEDNINKDSRDSNMNRTKSYSLSDLDMEYMCSSKKRNLTGEASIELLISELKDIFTKKRILKDGSKSFHAIIKETIDNSPDISRSELHLTILEKSMKTLEISQTDITEAKQAKDRFAQIIKEISVEDLQRIENTLSTKRFYMPKAFKATKSLSQRDDDKAHETCLCQIKKHYLDYQQSNQTLLESEIANVVFNEAGAMEMEKSCNANKFKEHLNEQWVVEGDKLVFNANIFLRKFVLKKNTSNNFGCQVSMLRKGFLEESRTELVKKFMCLRNFGLR